MPNWCMNYVELQGTEEQIRWIAKAIHSQCFFDKVVPHPKDMDEDSDVAERFRITQWGTKWESEYITILEKSPTRITAVFDTAWDMPLGVYHKLVELGVTVYAEYYEPGMNFGGYCETISAQLVITHSGNISNRKDTVRKKLIESGAIELLSSKRN